jgi:hypothetical protein
MKVWQPRLFTPAVVADAIRMPVTPQLHDCGASSGGGC